MNYEWTGIVMSSKTVCLGCHGWKPDTCDSCFDFLKRLLKHAPSDRDADNLIKSIEDHFNSESKLYTWEDYESTN